MVWQVARYLKVQSGTSHKLQKSEINRIQTAVQRLHSQENIRNWGTILDRRLCDIDKSNFK